MASIRFPFLFGKGFCKGLLRTAFSPSPQEYTENGSCEGESEENSDDRNIKVSFGLNHCRDQPGKEKNT